MGTGMLLEDTTTGASLITGEEPVSSGMTINTDQTGKVRFFNDLGNSAEEQTAKELLTNVAESLGTLLYNKEKCFVANYDKKFQPRYDKKLMLQLGFKTNIPITQKMMYTVIGFVEHGKTDAADTSFTYGGWQNALHTIGIGIDEQVDNKGSSWTPKPVVREKEGSVLHQHCSHPQAVRGRRCFQG